MKSGWLVHCLCLAYAGCCIAARFSNSLLQVVLSYLEDQPPDIESSQAAFEAYFAQPSQESQAPQEACNTAVTNFQLQALQFKEAICRALDALHAGDSTVVQSLCQQYPAAQALEALQTAVSIISTRLKQSSDSVDMLRSCEQAADSGELTEP